MVNGPISVTFCTPDLNWTPVCYSAEPSTPPLIYLDQVLRPYLRMLVPADLTDVDLAICLWDWKLTHSSTDREHMHNEQHLLPISPR